MTTVMRHATLGDLPLLRAMRVDLEARNPALAAGHDQGIPQIEAHLRSGRTWLAVDDTGRVIGSISLGNADPDSWTAAEQADPALYLYKVMSVVPGTGRVLLGHAEYRALIFGMDRLRLDCRRDDLRLQAYWQAHGFRHIRTVTVPGRRSGALFERPLSERNLP